jgi:hypothetical protein
MINNELGMRQLLSVKWILKCLKVDQEQKRVTTSRSICNQFKDSCTAYI